MRRRDNRKWLMLSLLFVTVSVFVFVVQKNRDFDVDAASLASFDPGYIMSDYQMSNYNSMTESEIQNFLSSKVTCDKDKNYYNYLVSTYPSFSWHLKNGYIVCLPDERFGDGEVIGSGDTAAHIIWQAAQDYKINPQVLIVLLQKEQGLITDKFPNTKQYRGATGYGCPDTAACSSKYYGFKNQVRNAAAMFRAVLDGGWTNYPLGNNYVQYNPSASCGGTIVNIRSLATSALYRYTPYQPNASALAVGYGVGDSCSAYGNRNFYLYFEDWFGDIKGEGLKVPKSSSVIEGEYVIKSKVGDNMVLDVSGGSTKDGANVQLYKNNGTGAQKWKVTKNGDGTYSIKNAISGKSLDVAGGSTKDGANVQSYSYNGTCAQKWSIVRNNDGSFMIYSVCSGRVLDVSGGKSLNGTNIQIYRPNGTKAQKWNFVSTQEVRSGEYSIAPEINNNYVIDITGGVGNAKNGTNIQLYERNNTSAQKWKLIYGSDGYYTIKNSVTGKVLDVAGGGTTEGTNVQLYTANQTCAQKWQIVRDGNGYVFYSACSDLVLDITNKDIANGLNVRVSSYNKAISQKWKITLVQDIESGDYTIRSALNSKKVLDVAGGGTYNGANVQLYSYNGTDAQKWNIQKNNDGYYSVMNPISGKVLDVAGGGTYNGANVQLYKSNGTCAQKWQIVRDDSNNFVLYSACSGLVLDVAGGSIIDGTNVQLYNSNNTVAQKWQLISD